VTFELLWGYSVQCVWAPPTATYEVWTSLTLCRSKFHTGDSPQTSISFSPLAGKRLHWPRERRSYWCPNTPITWCSRMVVNGKPDGNPRRTVDLQPQNGWSILQTHHVPSPFHLADCVPQGTKKTMTDAWNGYHSVSIHEEHCTMHTKLCL
jgi:hypothetical protein